MLTFFAGWGICGPLNSPGETDWYFVGTIIELIILGISSSLVILASSRHVPYKFKDNGWPYPSYLAFNVIALVLLSLVVHSSLSVFLDAAFGDGNLSEMYDEGIPCDPIYVSELSQSLVILALAIALFYIQYIEFKFSKNKAQVESKQARTKSKKPSKVVQIKKRSSVKNKEK